MKPALLFYCQHSLGLGHAVRSFALAGALTTHFRVVLACGGELPDGLVHSDGVELIALPALASRNGKLVPRGGASLGDARRRRLALLLETLRTLRPAAVVVELFPFGRRRFADELLPLLEEARGQVPRPLLVSSVRDILVGRERAHDTVNCVLANHYLDAVLVHADPSFARFQESFRPGIPLRVPVVHTGFVVKDESANRGERAARAPRGRLGRRRAGGRAAPSCSRGGATAAAHQTCSSSSWQDRSFQRTTGASSSRLRAEPRACGCTGSSPSSAPCSARPRRRSASAATTPRWRCSAPASRRWSCRSPR